MNPTIAQRLHGIASKMRDVTYVRYLAASVCALAVDVALFLSLTAAGTLPVWASAISYSVGIVVHWLLSSRKVFNDRVAERGAVRYRQKALFLVSAIIGLAVTAAIVGIADQLGIDVRLAKLVAIFTSFQLTYFLRNRAVFQL